ncbi:MAG TPA: M12 family metallo-peptidase [Pyrinomonadaceae bacterium]|nr:M12 family metallo-peptidase [Pyrinomonadaceae bacterium]
MTKPRVVFRLPIQLTLVLSLVVAFSVIDAYLPVGAQTNKTHYRQDLARFFSEHEEVQLDSRSAAEGVRRLGRLSLKTGARTLEIMLTPNDLRARGYRAEEFSADGVTRILPTPPVVTYKGTVAGLPNSEARLTVEDDKLEGMILTGDDVYYIEPGRRYSAAAQSSDYIFYRAADVRSDSTVSCPDSLGAQVNLSAKELMSQATVSYEHAFSPFKIIEIATEADFEYTNALGGSAAANNNILSILNSVEAIYERDIGLTFTVSVQHTWTSPDPYSTAGAQAPAVNLLNSFAANHPFGSAQRDVAHLWTGKDIGAPSGIAFQGVVCRSPGAAYGLSKLRSTDPFPVTVPAHELGHTLGASHVDTVAGCENSIMLATLTQSSTAFCNFSINEITSYVNANGSCLTDAPANPIDDPTFFVRQHYLDFLNRPADQSGLNFWVNNITSCGNNAGCIEVKRIDTSAAFFFAIEFQETGYLVERTYKTAYGDAPGSSQLGGVLHTIPVPIIRLSEFLQDVSQIGNGVVVLQPGWEQKLESNKVAYFNNFVSPNNGAFTQRYPSTMPPPDYVSRLNDNAGRPLPTTELATLTAEHTAGVKNRAQVLRQIAEHPNLATAERNRAFVLMQYFGYLRRNPNDAPDTDYTGYEFWLNKLTQFGDYRSAEMVKAFLSSTEYRRRFGPP